MKLRNLFCGTCFVMLLALAIQAQQTKATAKQLPSASESSESIDVGGVTLRLGMAQDYVLQHLYEHYDVQEFDVATSTFVAEPDPVLAEIKRLSTAAAESSWVVATKSGVPSSETLAEVIFTQGRLSSVRKFWTGAGEPDSETGFANVLYGAITSFEHEGKTPCEVMANSQQAPFGDTKTVRITCGGQKHLDIDFLQPVGGRESAGITEILGNYKGTQPMLLSASTPPSSTVTTPPSASTQTSSTQQVSPIALSPDELEAAVAARENARRNATKPAVDAAEDERREAAELANPSSLVTIRAGESLPDEALSRIASHNRALCDQTITVAGLTPNGLALYVPPEGQKFMAKNSQNYPRMCLLEDATNVVPSVPRYLLVYAYSENAFAGFQPVTRINTTTTPVSGSGTVRNAYGDAWNFNYYGTVETTEMDTIEAPYVIRSRSLYLNAYDENGSVVSRHSFTVSSQTGGNGASAIGYNGAQLIALLWNNPSRLIKSVLKDVQKDSKKYGNK